MGNFFRKEDRFLKIVGVICEYNPFHLGHQKQFDRIRDHFGPDTAIVSLMSGNFVQRGKPAIVDKTLRARAALLCGCDLVLELPIPYALSSAEGFAASGVRLLAPFCDALCFGTENGTPETLMDTAQELLSDRFRESLRTQLDTGKSFPSARELALEEKAALLRSPNDILAVEYCKAILAQGNKMAIFPITREGSYHASEADRENPSATSLRRLMLSGDDWTPYVPTEAAAVFDGAVLHAFSAGERAVLSQLRRMRESDFEVLPYGSEGLWRKLMHAVRKCASVDEILETTKSKRYTRSRLDRMVLCGYLGITREDISREIPYARVLGLSENGRKVLKKARQVGLFPNAGEAVDDPYWDMEQRCEDLFGLFAIPAPEKPGGETRRRIVLKK